MSETRSPLRLISLGAGVQSSTMSLLYARGTFAPMPDGAIFADTGAEPKAVYQWLDWLEKQLPFPVYRVMEQQGLTKQLEASIAGGGFAGVPFWTTNLTGTRGKLRRQCTREFKIVPLVQQTRRLLGIGFGRRAPNRIMAIALIGISRDEVVRMKPSLVHYIEHRWPLIDPGMSRQDCLRWMKSNGYPEPPRSACVYCPFHSDHEWKMIKEHDPEGWAEVVRMDEMIRQGVRGIKQKLFLHDSLQPIAEVQLSDKGQSQLWNEECEGMCGI